MQLAPRRPTDRGRGVTCAGLTKKGQPCKKPATIGDRCRQHAQPQTNVTNGRLKEAVATGDRKQALEALAGELASDIESFGWPSTGTIAPLARELRSTLAELDSMGEAESDPVDEVAAQREARRAAALSDSA